MNLSPLRTAVLILCSLTAAQAQAGRADYFNLKIDNIAYQNEELMEFTVINGEYHIPVETAKAHSLLFADSDTVMVGSKKFVNLSKLGKVSEEGSDIVFHVNEKNIKPLEYDFKTNSVTSERTYEDSAFFNYSYARSNISSTLNTSLYKTFSEGVLYNLNLNYSSLNKQKVTPVDLYREKYDRDNLTTLRIGTGYTGQNSLTSPLSFIGLQYKKDFSLDTNYLKNPYFAVSGTAQAQSVAEIFVNDKSIGRLPVAQGTYDFKNLTTGQTSANDVRVVVTDINGNVQQVQNVSLIGAPFNLKTGADNFSYETGLLRFGPTDFGPAFASGTYSYGMTDSRTVEVHGEAAPGQARISANWTEASKYGTFQYGIGAGRNEFVQKLQHNYTNGNFTLNTAILKSDHYSILGSLDRYVTDQKIVSFGYRFPTFNVSGSHVEFGDDQSRTSLTYSRSFGSSFLSVSLNSSTASGKGISFMFSTPLGNDLKFRSLTSASYDKLGANLTQTVMRNGDYNDWNANVSMTKDGQGAHSYIGQVQYSAEQGVATAQVQSYGGNQIATGRFDGAVILDQGIHFTKQIYQGYAIVNAEVPDLPISLNYIEVARTNKSGVAVIPNTYSIIDNVIGIDSKKLPPEIQVDESYFKIATQNYFKKTVTFTVKHDPVFLVPNASLEGVPEIQIGGKKYLVNKRGIYFDDYVLGKIYELNIGTCKKTFSIKSKPKMNEQISLDCDST